ncbi:uncharacterized protein DNG_05456 [Cephalotrichum gorgonifer]|uniref:Tim17 domain-containing protein n=1 Tax=Cephalotrichum gorgonifer TaxID=2041049 RepID=A0AAE8MXX8_9PEZI|nr:uncharacterized protein DNG_05456 [Cephalotrichum gorgonifer]
MSIWDTFTGRKSSPKPHTQTAEPTTTYATPAFDPTEGQGVDAFLKPSAFADPSSLHPLAGLDRDTLEYLSLDDTALAEGHTVVPSKGFFDDLCYGTGVTYVTALGLGGGWGVLEGLRRSENQPPKLRLNSVLNAVTRRGPFLGNSCGVIAIGYNFVNSYIGYLRGKDDAANAILAGTISGMAFRCTKGVKPMLVAGGVVGTAAAGWATVINFVEFKTVVKVEIMPQDQGTSSYTQDFLLRLVMGIDDEAEGMHQAPKRSGQIAKRHSSETVATRENRIVGILKVDSLGQQHLLPSDMEPLKQGFFPGNPYSDTIREWLISDFKARGAELRRWWEDPSNNKLASKLQKRYMSGDRSQRVQWAPSTWARSSEVLFRSFGARDRAVANISKYPRNTTLVREETPTKESQLGPRPTATPEISSDASNGMPGFPFPDKVEFKDLIGLVHVHYGIRMLWDKNRDRFPFHFEVKILVMDSPEFGSNGLPSDRVLPPTWSVQTAYVPFHCDSQRFTNHLEGLVLNHGSLCKKAKDLRKRGLHNASGWFYSNLRGDEDDAEFYLKRYVSYASSTDFGDIMAIVQARNTPIMAQADTLSSLRFIAKVATIDNVARGLRSPTPSDVQDSAPRDVETSTGNLVANVSTGLLALDNGPGNGESASEGGGADEDVRHEREDSVMTDVPEVTVCDSSS